MISVNVEDELRQLTAKGLKPVPFLALLIEFLEIFRFGLQTQAVSCSCFMLPSTAPSSVAVERYHALCASLNNDPSVYVSNHDEITST